MSDLRAGYARYHLLLIGGVFESIWGTSTSQIGDVGSTRLNHLTTGRIGGEVRNGDVERGARRQLANDRFATHIETRQWKPSWPDQIKFGVCYK